MSSINLNVERKDSNNIVIKHSFIILKVIIKE